MSESTFLKIGQYQYSSEAFIYKGKLEADGIEVFVRDNFTIDSDPMVSNAIGGVKLFVREEDYKRAIEILSEISTFSLDDNGKLLKCTNCGADKVQLITTVKDLKSLFSFLFSMIMVVIPFYNLYKYKCGECGYEF